MEDAPVRFISEVSFAREARDDFGNALKTLVKGKLSSVDAVFLNCAPSARRSG